MTHGQGHAESTRPVSGPQCATPILAAIPRSSGPPAAARARFSRYATVSRTGALLRIRWAAASSALQANELPQSSSVALLPTLVPCRRRSRLAVTTLAQPVERDLFPKLEHGRDRLTTLYANGPRARCSRSSWRTTASWSSGCRVFGWQGSPGQSRPSEPWGSGWALEWLI